MIVCCECCVLPGRGLCDELIIRPEESYRPCCIVICDLETTKILVNEEEVKAHYWAVAPRGREKKKTRIRHRLSTNFTVTYKSETFDVIINVHEAHESFTLPTMSELT
jgi:hypothetical protein